MRADVAMATEREAFAPPSIVYRPLSPLPLDPRESMQLDVRIAAVHVMSSNAGIVQRLVWGTDEYTEDSDLVAILQHCGFIKAGPTLPLGFEELVVTIQLQPHNLERGFPGVERNCIRSRSWGPRYRGRRLSVSSVEACWKTGKEMTKARLWSSMLGPGPHRGSTSFETGGPSPESGQPFVFNLSYEPTYPYNLMLIADVLSDADEWLSVRLRTSVLIVETQTDRFELALEGNPHQEQSSKDRASYRLSRVLNPTTAAAFSAEYPLADEKVDHRIGDLEWSDLAWTSTGLNVRSQHLKLVNMVLLRRRDAPQANDETEEEDAEPEDEEEEEEDDDDDDEEAVEEHDRMDVDDTGGGSTQEKATDGKGKAEKEEGEDGDAATHEATEESPDDTTRTTTLNKKVSTK